MIASMHGRDRLKGDSRGRKHGGGSHLSMGGGAFFVCAWRLYHDDLCSLGWAGMVTTYDIPNVVATTDELCADMSLLRPVSGL